MTDRNIVSLLCGLILAVSGLVGAMAAFATHHFTSNNVAQGDRSSQGH